MEISAKIYQNSTNVSYFLGDEPVKKIRGNKYEHFNGEALTSQESLEVEKVTNERETFSFPIHAHSDTGMNEEKDAKLCSHIADVLIHCAKTAYVKGRKFTAFSLNKPVNIAININGETLLNTYSLVNDRLINTFKLCYTENVGGVSVKKNFTKEEITEGLEAILSTARMINEVKTI